MSEASQLAAPADRRAHAADAYRASLAEGVPLTAAKLAEQFGRSRTWGRQVITETVAADRSNGGSHPATVDLTEDLPIAGPVTRNVQGATWQARVTALAVLVVAGVAAAISYSHMRTLALTAGEGPWQATALPLSVDGMMVAASCCALARKRAGLAVGWLPWFAVTLGVAASVAANIASAEPTVTGRAIAAWPPVALLVSLEMLLRQTRTVPVE